MIIYLAGGINANCKPKWCNWVTAVNEGGSKLKAYLDEVQKSGEGWVVDLYLACSMYGSMGRCVNKLENEISPLLDISILESFYYADEWTEMIIPKLKHFMLDSGAFTFFTLAKQTNWDEYLERYANFIVKNDVKLFFELDIDILVGYEKVLEFRKTLEQKTKKKCIPVWHKSRGLEEFKKMCDEYDYVAIGGIVSKEITKDQYKVFTPLINEAHKRGAKIHGLGFTNLKGLEQYHFDSVDSTSWTTGNRFGAIYRFNGRTMEKENAGSCRRLKDSRETAIHNFNEWVKFQKYAKGNL